MEIHQRAWVLVSLINHRPLKWKKVMLLEEGQVLIYFDLYLGRHGLHSAHLQSLPKSYWGTKTGRLQISFIMMMMMMIFWSCSSSVPAPAPAPPSSLSDSTWFILILIPIFLLDYQSKVTRDKLDFGHTNLSPRRSSDHESEGFLWDRSVELRRPRMSIEHWPFNSRTLKSLTDC